mmetsp:Transcript_31083/g.85109  ORF Transcript_31083/g.85109 Transcript_31083/m.85109 type:complete len:200 (-) Transcript_31083:303-902(-)
MGGLLVIPCFEHVQVIPRVRRAAELVGDARPLLDDGFRGVPTSNVVTRDPPRLGGRWSPLPWVVPPPLAHIEMDRAAGLVERLGHLRVGVFWRHALRVAPIHFHDVHAPLGEDIRVLHEMIFRSWAAPNASVGASASVQAEGEALGMGVVNDRLHAIGEVVPLRLEEARGVSLLVGPTIVKVEMSVARVVQTDRCECVD